MALSWMERKHAGPEFSMTMRLSMRVKLLSTVMRWAKEWGVTCLLI